jgi:multidrug efflux pump subunit AcrA (membrane-fusion protein)
MPTASWNQLERSIEQLHAAARAPHAGRGGYRLLLAEATSALDAAGGAAWRRGASGRPEPIVQNLPQDGVEGDWSARLALVERALGGASETLVGDAFARDAGEYDLLVCPVDHPATEPATASAPSSKATAVIELWMPRGATPPVRQGWLDFVAALADVAADFHARDELRKLRGAATLNSQAVDVLRRTSNATTLAAAAFEAANEGRRVLGCDRVSVLVRKGRRWRLAAVSGVDSPARRTDFARNVELLADQVARWGEPLERASQGDGGEEPELPPQLAEALDRHVDHSHARGIACAPIQLTEAPDGDALRSRRATFDLVLITERFEAGPSLRQALVELGELCAPAIARARTLDRFPLRGALRWSNRLAALREPARAFKLLLIAAAIAVVPAALVYIPAPLTIEAPAHLAAAVERDVFASASGSVAEVRVTHGQIVNESDVLVVLNDPELALALQETRGQIDAARKRLAAIAVTRTDRNLREETTVDRLPLAAEQRELEEKLASLEGERTLLESRRDALTLRSPRAGQVLTRDVERLLESRPVERGQSLLTIADTAAGWELIADVPQRRVGALLDAQRDAAAAKSQVGVTYRLAGDVEATYPGHVIAVSSAAPIEPQGLRDEAPPVEVRIAVDGEPPAAARPGMTAAVRIDCGTRPLGYVWLHDVGATLYRWATF